MIWVILIFLGIGIVSIYQGKKGINKAMSVKDEEERIAMMKLGKRTMRSGQVTLFILFAFFVAAILYVLFAG